MNRIVYNIFDCWMYAPSKLVNEWLRRPVFALLWHYTAVLLPSWDEAMAQWTAYWASDPGTLDQFLHTSDPGQDMQEQHDSLL